MFKEQLQFRPVNVRWVIGMNVTFGRSKLQYPLCIRGVIGMECFPQGIFLYFSVVPKINKLGLFYRIPKYMNGATKPFTFFLLLWSYWEVCACSRTLKLSLLESFRALTFWESKYKRTCGNFDQLDCRSQSPTSINWKGRYLYMKEDIFWNLSLRQSAQVREQIYRQFLEICWSRAPSAKCY